MGVAATGGGGRPPDAPRRELVVYFGPENASPTPPALAEALIAALGIGRAAVGTDALTGGVEVRLYDEPAVRDAVRAWLSASGAVYDLSYL